jgi:YidC/Oxa1 family membrane protein insertase
MGQQFYVIRRNPAPGTPAYDAWEERRKAKGNADVALAAVGDPEPAPEAATPNTNGQKARVRWPANSHDRSRKSRPGRSVNADTTEHEGDQVADEPQAERDVVEPDVAENRV